VGRFKKKGDMDARKKNIVRARHLKKKQQQYLLFDAQREKKSNKLSSQLFLKPSLMSVYP